MKPSYLKMKPKPHRLSDGPVSWAAEPNKHVNRCKNSKQADCTENALIKAVKVLLEYLVLCEIFNCGGN